MDRSAHQPAPRRDAAPFRPDQQEAFDGLLLALLARKRLLVLLGSAGSQRGTVFARLTEQVAADGALVLPVTARPAMQVEDLLTASSGRTLAEPGDFDALIEELEGRLDMAGSGLLAVDDAHLLPPATLVDLIELSRSETPSGRFLQILLSGTPELERALARPALDKAMRDLGVTYRLIGGDAPAMGEMEPSAFEPIAADDTPLPSEAPQREPWTAPAWMRPPGAGAGPRSRRHAVAGAWVAALILVAAGGTAVTLALQASDTGSSEDYAAQAERVGTRVAATVREWSYDTFGWPPLDENALALRQEPLPDMPLPPPPLPQASPPATQPPAPQVALNEPPSTRSLPPPDAAKAEPAPKVAPVPLPPPEAGREPVADAGPVPPTIVTPPIATPPTVQVPSIPPAPSAPPPVTVANPPAPAPAEATQVAEAAPPVEVAALPKPPVPATTAKAAQTAERVRTLAEQARRQIAGKRLTTPPGDNAYETVQRIRELSPSSPEVPALTAGIVETYRRWAVQAQAEGSPAEARRYYERALMVNPDDPGLRAQLKGLDERQQQAETQAASAQQAVAPPPAEPRDGFASASAALAVLRQPVALRNALASGQNPDQRLENGKTPLMLASEAGLRDATRLLLDRGANPNLRTRDGATAIMYAAWNGREDMVALLADAGANVDAGNDDGKTALMAAAARGHAAVVRSLLARGAGVDRTANHGWTALMYAAHAGHEPVIRLLMEAGANPSRTDRMGNSAVSLARQQGHALGALLGR